MTLNLIALAHELRTQDNAYTAHPIYIVQEEEFIYGIDSEYCDEYHWLFPDDGEVFTVPEDGEGLPLDEEQAEEFGYEKVYYHRQWKFKCAHLTLKAAEQYIETQRHNLKNPRVYVDSMHRCPEMIAIREFLMGNAVRRAEEALSQLITTRPDQDSDKWRFAQLALNKLRSATTG